MDKIKAQNLSVDGVVKAVQSRDRPDIRGKDKALSHLAVVQRLFPDPVPEKIKALFLLIIQGNGKHPLTEADPLPHPIGLEGLQQNLRVGASPKGADLFFPKKLLRHTFVIIDFSIVYDHITPAMGGHGLGSLLGQIDDGQSSVSQRHLAVLRKKASPCVGSSVIDPPLHTLNVFLSVSLKITESRYSAHISCSLFFCVLFWSAERKTYVIFLSVLPDISPSFHIPPPPCSPR